MRWMNWRNVSPAVSAHLEVISTRCPPPQGCLHFFPHKKNVTRECYTWALFSSVCWCFCCAKVTLVDLNAVKSSNCCHFPNAHSRCSAGNWSALIHHSVLDLISVASTETRTCVFFCCCSRSPSPRSRSKMIFDYQAYDCHILNQSVTVTNLNCFRIRQYTPFRQLSCHACSLHHCTNKHWK